jgi:hypothetical membrane protein
MPGDRVIEWQEFGVVPVAIFGPFGPRTWRRPAGAAGAAGDHDRIATSHLEIVMSTTLAMSRPGTALRADLARPGLLLVVLAAQFMTVIMLAASVAPGYDVHGGAISDLGVIAQTALLFNVSLVAVGVLNLAAGFTYHRSHGRGWVLAVFVLASIGAAGAGLVPLDAGGMHGLFALGAFLFFNAEALACATVVHGPMRWISALAGIVGLAFVVLMAIGDSGNPGVFGPIGHGGAERMIVYPPMLWLLAFGGYLIGTRSGEPAR